MLKGAVVTLEQVYFIAGVVSSLAVVASLLFVGLQLRHSAKQQRIATAAGYYEIFRDHMKLVENPQLTELFIRGLDSGWDTFTDTERTTLSIFYTMITRGYQVMHYQEQNRVFEPDFWIYTQEHFRDHLVSKFYQDFWRYRRHHFPTEFQKLVDELIRKGPTAPILPVKSD